MDYIYLEIEIRNATDNTQSVSICEDGRRITTLTINTTLRKDKKALALFIAEKLITFTNL